jgi:hypothetical protein
MYKNIKWANKELPGLSHDELNKLTYQQLAASETGKYNAESGLLKRIAKKGGEAVGKTAHIRLNQAQTSESRSKSHKKTFDKKLVEESLLISPFNKERAKWLGVTEVTYRKVLKEHNLYIKESAAEKFMKYLSAEERSSLLNNKKK